MKKLVSTTVIEDLPLSDLAIPPGETLRETLEFINLSQDELASRMGRPAQVVSEIITARKTITAETALQLEDGLGIPAYLWLGLEADYQLTLAQEMRKNMASVESNAASRKKAA